MIIPGLTPEIQANLVISAVVVLALLIVRRVVLAIIDRSVEDPALRYRWAKASGYVAFVVGLVMLVPVWFVALRSLGTFLGLASAGLAIALKDPIANLAGWIFILWRRPFDVGDRVQVGPFAGDVVDVGTFQFTLMEIGNWVDADQSTGRLIHVPNGNLFTQPVANYVAGFPYLWNELEVVLTFDSNWRRGKQLLEKVAADMTVDITREATQRDRRGDQRFLIHYRKLTPIVYTSVVENGVRLTIRYLCRPRERRGTAADLWERVLDAMAGAPDVVIAHPTQRIHVTRAARPSPEALDPSVREGRGD
jgi:small-conductance mechanosensitive channel